MTKEQSPLSLNSALRPQPQSLEAPGSVAQTSGHPEPSFLTPPGSPGLLLLSPPPRRRRSGGPERADPGCAARPSDGCHGWSQASAAGRRKRGCGRGTAGEKGPTWKTEIFLMCEQSREPTETKGKRGDNPTKAGRAEGALGNKGSRQDEPRGKEPPMRARTRAGKALRGSWARV